VQGYASVQICVDNNIISDRKVDALIANAGIGFARSTEQASEADMVEVMDINFMGVVRCVKAVFPHMRAARSDHVVAITSV
jgi:NADP-dependent 3-hydroxy acid dehydrogenase YdfG